MSNIFYQMRLRRLRKLFGFTQTELAKLLGLRGKEAIAKIETGKRSPSSELLYRLTLIFDKPLQYFIPTQVKKGEEEVAMKTEEMVKELEGKDDKKSKSKLALLEAINSRMAVNQHTHYDKHGRGGQDQRH
jgi:transcriptional regulator with XRE-family HTH domain